MSSAERSDAPLPPAGAGAAAVGAYEVPALDARLYDRAVFTMPLTGKLKHAEIVIFFLKTEPTRVYAKLVPGGHCWHGFEAAFAPATGFTQPVGHSVHAASVVAPAVAPNVPGGHSAHTACADAPVAEL